MCHLSRGNGRAARGLEGARDSRAKFRSSRDLKWLKEKARPNQLPCSGSDSWKASTASGEWFGLLFFVTQRSMCNPAVLLPSGENDGKSSTPERPLKGTMRRERDRSLLFRPRNNRVPPAATTMSASALITTSNRERFGPGGSGIAPGRPQRPLPASGPVPRSAPNRWPASTSSARRAFLK